jgi:phage terminase large subunit-like protein
MRPLTVSTFSLAVKAKLDPLLSASVIGSVRLLVRAGWLEEFVAELLAFPSRHDDQVDALTQALAWARRRWNSKFATYPLRGDI